MIMGVDEELSCVEGLSWQDLVRVSKAPGCYEASLDGTSGELTWKTVSDEAVAHVVRKKWIAAMLNDVDRAKAYEAALKKTGTKGVVLDVGAGTGLLSQLAALKTDAEHVVACEMEPSMAAMATRNAKITFAVARSSDVDLPTKATLLVSELLDTFLVGEGVLPTTRDALKRLCDDDAKSIPTKAILYCALINCPALERGPPLEESEKEFSFFDDDDKEDDDDEKEKEEFRWQRQACSGGTIAEPVRIAALKAKCETTWLTDPKEILNFDLTSTSSDSTMEAGFAQLESLSDGYAHAIIYWWRVELAEGIFLTNSPFEKSEVVQDHWHQAAQPLPRPTRVKKSEKLAVRVDLDESETSLRFY